MHTDVGRCLGKAIADARQQAGLTQEQLAAKINISTRTFQAYEAGDMLPRYKTLFKIAKETHTPAPDLLAPMWDAWLESQ